MACGTELQDSINVRNQKERVEKFLKEVLIIMDKNLIEMWCYHRSLSEKLLEYALRSWFYINVLKSTNKIDIENIKH